MFSGFYRYKPTLDAFVNICKVTTHLSDNFFKCNNHR